MSEPSFDYKEALARLDELNASYSYSDSVHRSARENSVENSGSTIGDISDQCNLKCNVEDSNLKYENDVLRNQLEDQRKELNALKKKTRKLESALLRFNHTIKKNEIEIDSLKAENETMRSECQGLEDQLKAANKELEVLRETQKGKSSEAALERLKAVLESEMEQKREITRQRDELVGLLNRQTQLICEYDKAPRSEVGAKRKQEREEVLCDENVNDDYDVLYTTLGGVVRLALKVKGCEGVVEEIKGNSAMSVNERIIGIVKHLVSRLEERQVSAKVDDGDARRVAEEAEQRSLRILSVLEEEIEFIRKLSESDSLQSIVFLSMNERDRSSVDLKKFLVEHCAKIGHFIEQSLPRVSVCSTIDELQALKINTGGVFDLLKPVSLAEKIESVSQFSPENREMFDLFVAGVTMSSLVYRQYNEMKIRLERAQNRVQELHSLADSAMTYRNELKEHEDKEMEIRSIVGRVFDASPRCDIVDLISAVMKYFMENGGTTTKKKAEKKLKDATKVHVTEMKSMVKTHKQELETVAENFKKAERQWQEQLEESHKQMLAREQTIQEMNQTIATQKERIEALAKKLDENNALLNERMKKKELREEMLQKECKAKEKMLQKCVLKIEAKLRDKEKELANSQSEIVIARTRQSQLENDIQELKSQCELRLREQKLSFDRTTSDMRTQIAKMRKEDKQGQTQARQLQIRNTELESQNSKLKTELETITLQYKSQESKIRNEITSIKSQLELQKTTLCSEHERQAAAVFSFMERLLSIVGKPAPVDSSTNIHEQMATIIDEVESVVADVKRCIVETRAIEKIRQVLKVKPEENLIQVVVRLLESYQASLEDKDRLTNQINEQNSTVEVLKRYERETEEKIVSLRQWDIWSRRLLRIRRGLNPDSLGQDQVRLLLEEELLMGSLSTDTLKSKITMLRFEKQIMEPFVDWTRFKTRSKEPDWVPILILVRFVISQRVRNDNQENGKIELATRARQSIALSPILAPKVALPGIDSWND